FATSIPYSSFNFSFISQSSKSSPPSFDLYLFISSLISSLVRKSSSFLNSSSSPFASLTSIVLSFSRSSVSFSASFLFLFTKTVTPTINTIANTPAVIQIIVFLFIFYLSSHCSTIRCEILNQHSILQQLIQIFLLKFPQLPIYVYFLSSLLTPP